MEKILIVDDDRHLIQNLDEVLSSLGYNCDFLTRAEFLYPKLELEVFDLILLDINLPGTDGITILKELKKSELYRDIPVIMITAEVSSILTSICFKFGADDYLAKPIEEMELKARIRSALDSKKYKDYLLCKNRILKIELDSETTKRQKIEEDLESLQQELSTWKQLPEEIRTTMEELLLKFGTSLNQLSHELKESLITITATYGQNLGKFIEFNQKVEDRNIEIHQNKIDFLKKIPLFEGLKTFDLFLIADQMEEIEVAPHVDLLIQDQPADGVYFIKEGNVGISVDRELVAHRKKGESIGEMSCLRNEVNASATVTTIEPTTVWRIKREQFMELIDRFPELWKKVFYEMTDRFQDLNHRKSELLQHSGEGLIKVDPTGNVTEEFSGRCIDIFGSDQLTGEKIDELLFQNDKERKCWQETFPLIFEEHKIDFSTLCSLLPKETILNNPGGNERYYQLNYHSCRGTDETIKAIDIGIRDTTREKELDISRKKLEREQETLHKIYDDPDAFMHMRELLTNCQAELERLDQEPIKKNGESHPGIDTVDLMRKLHTLKGISGVFLLDSLKELSHHIETSLKSFSETLKADLLKKELVQELQQLEEEKLRITNLLENISPELRHRLTGVVIGKEDFDKLKSAAGEMKDTKVQQLLLLIERVPVRKLVQSWPEEIKKLEYQLNKQAKFRLLGENFSIPRNIFKQLAPVLPHILRNSMDHGLEFSEERERSGKEERGEITTSFFKEGEKMILEFSDDGKGIDFEKVAEKARKNPQLDQKLINHLIEEKESWKILLLPNFSTAERVSIVSGRGVGMDVINDEIKKLGGTIRIESELGSGTCFTLEIPLDK